LRGFYFYSAINFLCGFLLTINTSWQTKLE
jgi:hypothetical protein